MPHFWRGDSDIQTILTIAGFDPSSGAGITADLAVIAAHGFFGTSAITALTVQSTLGVRGTHAAKPSILRETLRFLNEDIVPDGVKIGMLSTSGNAEAVADFLHQLHEMGNKPIVVLDPVLRSSSGRELLGRGGIDTMIKRLLPLVDWITPNFAELGVLGKVKTSADSEVELASSRLSEQFPDLNLVATGGDGDSANDLITLANGSQTWLRGVKIASRSTHGTGCAFSTALLCNLVAGRGGVEAAGEAKKFVAEAIRQAEPIGHGIGPMNLLWPLRNG